MSVGATGGSPSGGRLWEILSFSVIGVVSTVANLVLYAVFRLWRPVLVANLAALVLTTLFNTEANRRFTFVGAATSRRKPHVQGLVVFGLHHVFTVLFAASVPGTAGRFVLLRSWVFRKFRGKDEE
ncbi:GtrA family protein [Amycolatopsis sp. NPDC004169]|uniref:GtrA family protein n=1 Tax=Amycolatopsis sp. NPDC004169 TaxID=3154453 RepID=UPI0033A7EA04